MSFDFPFVRLFGVRKFCYYPYLHPRILHDLYEELGKPITIIFKDSIENKNIPNEWREGCITPLFKKGSRKMASNYISVSLTCILCKVLEKFVRDHIVNHMKRNTFTKTVWFHFWTVNITPVAICIRKMDQYTR